MYGACVGSCHSVSMIMPRLYRVTTFFSKYQIPGFLKVFGPKFQVFCAKLQVLLYKF